MARTVGLTINTQEEVKKGLTKDEIIEKLIARGIDFDENAKKNELAALLKESE